MLNLTNEVTEFSILLPEQIPPAPVVGTIGALLSDTYETPTWQELLPMVNAYLQLSESTTMIWYLVVFVAMGFGIVNTLLMAVFERMREFGLLKALGMKPRPLSAK